MQGPFDDCPPHSCTFHLQVNLNVALAWRPPKGSGAELAMHMQARTPSPPLLSDPSGRDPQNSAPSLHPRLPTPLPHFERQTYPNPLSQRTVVWKRMQRVLTHPDVERSLKARLGIDVPIRFREFFFVRELPGHSLGIHTGNNGKKVGEVATRLLGHSGDGRRRAKRRAESGVCVSHTAALACPFRSLQQTSIAAGDDPSDLPQQRLERPLLLRRL